MSLPSITEFENVLKNILSDNNQIRKQAEDYFNKAKTQPDYCVSSLVHILRASQKLELRSLACVLLRKCIAKSDDSLYGRLSQNVKNIVKIELLTALADEKIDHIRSKLVYTLSGFVAALMEDGENPDVLPKMFEWAKSSVPHLKESALGIFNQLATHLMSKGLAPFLDPIKEIFTLCLNDPSTQSHKVRIAALEATCSVVMVLDKQQRAKFQDIIPHMLQVLARALNANDVGASTSIIESLIEIVVSHPAFFKAFAPNVITAMFQVAKTKTVEDSVRHLAMEFMISMAEAAPTMTKKIPNFVENLFPLCMDMMLDIEEDENWAESFEDEDLELTNYDVGLESLDRLALAIGGQAVQPTAFKIIPPFLNNSNWKHRLIGLMAIAQTAEGCQEQYQNHLQTLVGMTLTLFKDTHPRVRHAAIHCAAQLSTDFSGVIQSSYHGQIVPALLGAMDDPIARVQSHAATAVVNFVEECENKFIEPYLDALLSKLLHLLRGGRRFVQEQSLSAISAVADCAETLFVKYYDHIMPFLKEILFKATGKQDRKLRARAIECVSLIGVAVGKTKFGPDAKQVMELLMRTQQQAVDPDDPQIHHLLQAWARMAKCLGDDFIPYLSYVMPPLLKAADQQPEVVVADADEDSRTDEEGMESVTLSIKGVGDKRISIRTSILEEKALACSMLYSYVFELKDGFCPWVEPVAKIMVPLLKFPYLEEIRETAGTIMPQLLKSVKLAAEKGKVDSKLVKQLLDFILLTLIDALKIEPEVKTSTILAESLNECLQVVGNECLSLDQIDQITQTIKSSLLASIVRKKTLQEEYQEEEDEEEQDRIDEDQSLEDDLLTTIVDLVGNMFKTHQHFVQAFLTHLWPVYCKMLDPKLGDDEHRVSLCVICDFIEHGKGTSVTYSNDIIPALMNYSIDQTPEVRQAAVYGVGACAQYGGTPFNSVISEVIQKLKQAITLPNAREDRHAAATANAVSALFKVIQFRGDSANINRNELLAFWMQALPVSGDNIEAKIVHKNFVELVIQNNPIILGQSNANIPFILKVFANILDTDRVSDESASKISQILKQMQVQMPAQMLQQAWTLLSQPERTALQTAASKQK